MSFHGQIMNIPSAVDALPAYLLGHRDARHAAAELANAADLQIENLTAENKKMKALLLELLPDLESRVTGLKKCWPGEDILAAMSRNEAHVRKIKEITTPEPHAADLISRHRKI